MSAHRTTPRASTRTHRGTTLVAASAAVVLLAAVVLSLTIGARDIALADVWRALIAPDVANPDHVVVLTQRVPRTVIGLCAGAALALAGTVMQGLTRNPFADPGLLGVNAGASVAVLVAITLFGLVTPTGFIWFAFVGAAAAAVATLDVYQEEGLLTRAMELAPYWEERLHALKGLPHIIDLRNIGLIGAIEVEPLPGQPGKRAYDLFVKAFENNALIRQTGDIIALSPPLIVSKDQIDQLFDTLTGVFKTAA